MLDRLIDEVKQFFDRDSLRLIAATIFVGIMTHFLLLTHVIKNADCWQYSNTYQSGRWEVSIGRWFLPIWDFVRGSLNIPYLTAIFSIIIISVVPIVISKTLKLNKTVTVLLAITLVVSPYMSIIMTYSYCSDTYSLAFLFAAIGALMLSLGADEKRNRLIRIGVGAIFIMLSLAIYQIYLGVTCVLLMLKLIREATEEPLSKKRVTKLMRKLGIYIAGLGLGMGLYSLVTSVVLRVTDLHANQVYGAFGNSVVSIIKNIPARVIYIYQRTYKYFLQTGLVKNRYFRNQIIAVFLVFFVVWVIYSIWQYSMNWQQAIIYIVGIALVPVVAEGVLMASPGDELSLRLSGPLIMCLPLLLYLVKWDSVSTPKILIRGANLFLILYLWTCFLSANATYASLITHYNQEKTYSQQIVYEIERQDAYYRGMPVCIIGTINTDEFGEPSSAYPYAYWSNSGNIYRGEKSYASASKNWFVFMTDELGVNLNMVGIDTFREIYASEEFKEMKLFPKEGSVKMIDGVMVVKLSEEQ